MRGIVIKLISNCWTVNANGKIYNCTSKGKFRHMKVSPIVGDIVLIDEDNNVIKEIEKRKNELIRPPVANVDQALILTSCKEPNFSSNLLDKMLTIISYNNIEPIICFTKYDLLDDKEEIDEIINYYKKIGYKVFINDSLEEIKEVLNNKVSVLTGQTGVGKSTLLNKIKEDLNLATGEISKALGRGRHTTRHVELLDVAGGLVADTPGFSSLDFRGMNKKDIRDNFKEFYENSHKCKYQDCAHINEDGCFIKELVSKGEIRKTRYDNYKLFINQLVERKF